MAIVKEYYCPGHGSFESDRPICPSGCTVAEREFRTAPAYHDGNNKRVDNLVRSQVEAMGLGNIKTGTREGETARIVSPAMRQAAEFQSVVRKKYPSNWGAIPKGDTAIPQVLAAHHAEAADSTAVLRGTRPTYQAVQDKQGLKLDISKAA